jgi:hypothetical protein
VVFWRVRLSIWRAQRLMCDFGERNGRENLARDVECVICAERVC